MGLVKFHSLLLLPSSYQFLQMQQNGAIRWLVRDQPILSVRRAIARLITCMISRKWSLDRLCISSKVKQSANLRNCTKLSKCSKLALSLSCWSRTMQPSGNTQENSHEIHKGTKLQNLEHQTGLMETFTDFSCFQVWMWKNWQMLRALIQGSAAFEFTQKG